MSDILKQPLLTDKDQIDKLLKSVVDCYDFDSYQIPDPYLEIDKKTDGHLKEILKRYLGISVISELLIKQTKFDDPDFVKTMTKVCLYIQGAVIENRNQLNNLLNL